MGKDCQWFLHVVDKLRLLPEMLTLVGEGLSVVVDKLRLLAEELTLVGKQLTLVGEVLTADAEQLTLVGDMFEGCFGCF